MPAPTLLDRCRQAANLMLALAQLAAPFFAEATGIGQPIESRQPIDPATMPEGPAGYAFGIWFLIFALALGYAVRQALPSEATRMLYRRVGWLTAGLFLTSTLWMLLAQAVGDGWHLVAVIVGMWALALTAWLRALSTEATAAADRVVRVMLGLYAGWLTLAVALNTTSVARLVLTDRPDPTDWALLTLLPAGAAAIMLAGLSGGQRWYLAAVLWGLAGIVVANLTPSGNPTVIGVAMALGAALLAVAWLVRRRSAETVGAGPGGSGSRGANRSAMGSV